MNTSVGILGVALYLPPIIRGNDWWPREIVARWKDSVRPPPPPPPYTPGMTRVMKALMQQAEDPFQSAVSRHVTPDDMTVIDMAVEVGRDAVRRAGVSLADVDLLLTSTVLPDVLLGNPACEIHDRLGLARQCFAMETTAATYSFLMQLSLAHSMIASGRAKLALLIQSCSILRFVDKADPISPLFGDGATAVVVGPVSQGRGIIAEAHYCDGRFPDTLIASPRGGVWSSPGPGVVHVADPVQMRDVFLSTADVLKESIDGVLAKAGLSTKDIQFFATHQGTPWLRQVVQDYAGLGHARSIESFAETGYMFAAIIPAGLALAERAGLLAKDDVVLATGGGPGITFGSIVMRWGA